MVRLTVSIITLIVLTTVTALAQEHAQAALTVKTERVIVFKDGYCMFIKNAVGETDAAGRASIDGIPDAAVLGSFWVTPKTGKLTNMIAKPIIIPRQGRQERRKVLLLEFDSAGSQRSVEVQVLHLSPGIRWIPTYRLALNKDGGADMMMQAEILNEAEDITDVAVDLVVGVPNFRFKDVVSPLSLESNLSNPLLQAAPQLMTQSMSNIMATQRMGDLRELPAETGRIAQPGVPAVPPELAGEGAQDLFVYHVPPLTLAAGQRAAIPLLSARVPFRHLYTWDVRLSRAGAEALPTGAAHISPVKLLKNDVWHQIELTNNTDVPWTTGAALMMQDYLPVAQELLTYTSVGSKCQIPLTVAVDVRGTYTEEEVARDLNALHFDGRDYVRISKKGTLQVTNRKKDSIDLTITCEFGGNATKASDGGEISVIDFADEDWRDFRGVPALTGHSTVRWNLKLSPGETKKVTCEYSYYAR